MAFLGWGIRGEYLMKEVSGAAAAGKEGTVTQKPTTGPDAGRAIGHLPSHVRLWLPAVVGLAADLVSKRWALGALGDAEVGTLEPVVLIEGYLRFSLVFNRGAVAGMAAGQTALLVAASVGALVFVLWLFSTSRSDAWGSHVALGMIVAGALGNTYDRLFHGGKVIDFIEVNLHVWPANPWPTFNVADILLCVGVGLLIISLMKNRNVHQ